MAAVVMPTVDAERLARIKSASADGAPATPTPTAIVHKRNRARAHVATIRTESKEPEIPLTLGGDVLVLMRAGWITTLIGGSGRGKTSLAACLLVEHAIERGPALAFTLELPPSEWVARAIGSRCDASWLSVLRGELGDEQMLAALPDRLDIVGRHEATFAALEAAIDALQHDYPGQPLLVAVDYVQIMASEEREVRRQVADVMKRLDDVARRKRVAMIALSQGSRVSARALTSGDKLGAATSDSGAEAAELERWSSCTIAIGRLGAKAEDGTRPTDLNIGKVRHNEGDTVQPARIEGRTGRFRLTGAARLADEVRSERASEKQTAEQATAELAILKGAELAKEPQSRDDLEKFAGTTGRMTKRAAVAALLKRGDLTEVMRKKPRAKAWLIWTTAQATAAGIQVVVP